MGATSSERPQNTWSGVFELEHRMSVDPEALKALLNGMKESLTMEGWKLDWIPC
jgi:hypothetical protein